MEDASKVHVIPGIFTGAERVAKAAACIKSHAEMEWEFPKRLDEMTPTEQGIAGIACRLMSAIQFANKLLNET